MPRRRTPLRAKRYMNPRSVKPLRIAARKGGQEHYAHLRALVHAREGGNCARCGIPTPITVGECHHRLLRSRGGKDDPWTCVWLCNSCHHDEIHAHPAQATAEGWLVPSHADPASWPVLRHGAWLQPTPDGWVRSEPDERQAAS